MVLICSWIYWRWVYIQFFLWNEVMRVAVWNDTLVSFHTKCEGFDEIWIVTLSYSQVWTKLFLLFWGDKLGCGQEGIAITAISPGHLRRRRYGFCLYISHRGRIETFTAVRFTICHGDPTSVNWHSDPGMLKTHFRGIGSYMIIVVCLCRNNLRQWQ